MKQSKFEGSNRELRSKILKIVMRGPIALKNIKKELAGAPLKGIIANLRALDQEGFIRRRGAAYRIAQ